jgi:hypothetical protein
LLLAGEEIQFYDLQDNTQQSYELNEVECACVNNKDKEIIILNNKVFSKYFYGLSELVKISEVKISGVEDDVVINEIVVNEENKHVYGISDSSRKLFHFDKEFILIQIMKMKITTSLSIKVFNNYLYMLLKGYGNVILNNTNQIIENKKSFIDKYSQKEKEFIKFKRNIVLDVLLVPIDFHVDDNYIFIFTDYINKHYKFDLNLDLFLFNHKGKLLQRTGLDIPQHLNTKFLIVGCQTIYCADFEKKTFKKLKFSNLNIMDDDENI